MNHELKCWPRYFEAITSGSKTFEIRKNDRGYQVGDVLNLREYDVLTESYTGRGHSVLVTYVLPGGGFGLPSEYVAMSIVKAVGEIGRQLGKLIDNHKDSARVLQNCNCWVDWTKEHFGEMHICEAHGGPRVECKAEVES